MSYFEKDAIISGIGISRIGRRTGIPGFDLTMEAVQSAIADAGLAAADIDGLATLGDTPRGEVNAALSIDAADCGSGFGRSGAGDSGASDGGSVPVACALSAARARSRPASSSR